MRIINGTWWSTEDLRRIIAASMKARGVKSTRVTVTIAKAKKYVTGFARLGRWVGPTQLSPNVVAPRRFIQGGYMTIRIPAEVDPCDVARVIDHEVAHLAGLKHADMGEALYNCTQSLDWLPNALPILAPEAEPDGTALAAASRANRFEHAKVMLARAETRAKRAQTILKKWRRRVSAMQRSTP